MSMATPVPKYRGKLEWSFVGSFPLLTSFHLDGVFGRLLPMRERLYGVFGWRLAIFNQTKNGKRF